MPKETLPSFRARMARKFKNELRTDGSILFCRSCNAEVSASKVYHVNQHFSTAKHKKNSEKQIETPAKEQALLMQCTKPKIQPFSMDLCQAFLRANIPLKKVANLHIKNFFEKYTKQQMPSESVLRQKYVPILFNESMNDMKKKALNKHIWISVDETTDVDQRLIVNFIFGVLEEDENFHSYLLNVGEIDAGNANNIATFVNDSLFLLWPDGIEYDHVLIAVTDAAPYMVAAMRSLKAMFSKMLHLTCFAHGLHRVCEFIRGEFQDVNLLISNIKAIFVKAPSRRKNFKLTYPELPLPPTPSTISWGTWLRAAEYYSDNFLKIKSLVESFKDEDSEAIRKAKDFFAKESLHSDLAFIKSNFAIIHHSITKLEAKGLSLKTSLKHIGSVKKSLKQLDDKKFLNKFDSVFGRNPGFKDIKIVEKILFANKEVFCEYTGKLTPTELSKLRYCPVTSCDVERSFSAYGSLLTEKRRKFTLENLKQHMIVYCNSEKSSEEDA